MATTGHRVDPIGAVLLVAALALTGVVTPGPARADTESYLNKLRGLGITNPRGDIGMQEWGWEVCEMIAKGFPPDKVLQQSVYNSGARPSDGMTVEQANAVVNVAVTDLCTARK